MKIACCFLLMIILLFGCAVKGEETVFETVADEVLTVSATEGRALKISVQLPDHVQPEALSEENCPVFQRAAGSFSLSMQTVEASSVDEAVKQLTGFSRADLQIIPLKILPQRSYRLSWCAAEDDGIYLYRAAMVEQDGNYFMLRAKYAEGASGALNEEIDNIFATFYVAVDGEA